MANPNCEMWQC